MLRPLRTAAAIAALMALIPAAVHLKNIKQNSSPPLRTLSAPASVTFTDSTGTQNTVSADTLVLGLVGASVPSDFSDEAVKALSTAYATQTAFENSRNELYIDTESNGVYLSDESLRSKFGDNFEKLRKLCGENSKVIISGNDAKNLNIPTLSKHPIKNEDIKPKANPFSAYSGGEKSTDTVLAESVNIMASQGNTCEEILWYFLS